MTQYMQWQEIYQNGLVPSIFGPWSTATLELAVPQPGDKVLDIACGTGIVARLAAQFVGRTGHVVGLDANPGMIEVARSLPSPPGLTIEWREGNALALPFSEPKFNIVFCQGGLQFMPERLTALQEMWRVLLPGGRLAILVFQEIQFTPGFAVVVDALESFAGAHAAEFLSTPFVLSDAEELRSLLVEAGFHQIVIRPEIKIIHFPSPEKFVHCLIMGSPRGSQIDEQSLAKIISQTSARLQSYTRQGELFFPMRAHLASARR